MSIILGIIIFIAGLVLGVHVKGVLFSRLEWSILKWDNKVFAYRPAPKGVMINRNDKVFMALRLPTANMPEEGFKFE
jgi:uncharacterized membrane protein YciS (DUF1049 family)